MATTTNGSVRIFHSAYHYKTAPYGQVRASGIHKGTDYGTSKKALPQYPPLGGAIVRQVVTKETNGDARGCRVRMEWPELNLGMILQHLVEGSVAVKVGDILTKDTQIGLTGITGKYSNGSRVSTGVHAHVEVYYINQGQTATFDFESLDFDEIEKRQNKEEEMTREEVKAIVREVLEESATIPSSWAVEWTEARDAGITDGTKPQAVPTREQVASMIVRALKAVKVW